MNEYDYIIIGGGLAGTILADFLSKSASVLVFDHEAGTYGSKVAAGIFNPVTGRRMVKSWKVDTLAPFALDYYKQKEKQLNQKLIDVIDIKRLFNNEQQRNEWLQRVDFDQLQEIIAHEVEPDIENSTWHNQHGGVTTTTSWRLNTAKYIDGLQANLIKNQCLIKQLVDYSNIKVLEDHVLVNEKKAKKLIFSEGWNLTQNPWFGALPIRPNKGELLTIEAKSLDTKELVQKRIFVLPIGNNHFKVGATYDRENLNYSLTDTAKSWLIERLNQIIKVPYTIIDHKAGIRPATLDRRPFVGQHQKHDNLFIFNGFGSKGVHQMPWIANHFVKVLQEGAELIGEIDIGRFNKRK